MKTKRCSKCGEVKPINEFHKNKANKDGHRYSCKICLFEHKRKRMSKNPYKFWVNNTLRKHKHKGFKVNISRDELIEIAKNTTNCPFCGCKLEWSYGKGASKNSPTLDRINNEGVLTLKNTQILCRRCNGIKQEKSMQEFIEYCTIISNKFN